MFRALLIVCLASLSASASFAGESIDEYYRRKSAERQYRSDRREDQMRENSRRFNDYMEQSQRDYNWSIWRLQNGYRYGYPVYRPYYYGR